MFKCCGCSASSKGSRSKTDSDSSDTPSASRKSDQASDEKKEMSPTEIKANGVPWTEETEETKKTKETPVESVPETEETKKTPVEAASETEEVKPAPETKETGESPVESAPKTEEIKKIPIESAPETEETKETPVESAPETKETEKTPVESAPETEETEKSPVESTPETEETEKTPVKSTPKTEETEKVPVESVPETEVPSVEQHDATEDKKESGSPKAAEVEINKDDVNIGDTEEKSDSSTTEEKTVQEVDDREEKSDLIQTIPDDFLVEEKADLAKDDDSSVCGATIQEYEQVTENIGFYNEGQIDGVELSGPEADSIIVAITVSPSSTKTNLYCNSGYIERTIDDGPDDEGDDSVFETCPGENEAADKAHNVTLSGLLETNVDDVISPIVPRAEEMEEMLVPPYFVTESPSEQQDEGNGAEDKQEWSSTEEAEAEIRKDDATDKAQPVGLLSDWISQQHDALEKSGEHVQEEYSGMQEPPATPVARDELALRRHRFFSELLQIAQNTEHKVWFDPLGPRVHTGCGGQEVNDREEYLEKLVNRLENVTQRLEKVPIASLVQTQDTSVQVPSPRSTPVKSYFPPDSPESPSDLVCASEQIIPQQLTSMSVAGYQDLFDGPVGDYLMLSQKIGGDVAAQSHFVDIAFRYQKYFIEIAATRAAPTNQSEYMDMLQPLSGEIMQIQKFRETHRGSPFFNHLSAISESIPALGWVTITPTPAPYVKEMNDAGQFYTNRVLKEWKEKDKIHIDWCKAWVQTLTDLQQYIRQHHTTGLVWGKTGAAPAGIPPPPPPSMPIGDISPLMTNDDRSALFAQINQGEDITKNLKKVTSDMQTHKNPSLRSGPAPFKAPTIASVTPMKSVIPANAPIDKPPVFTRDGKKWLVEYQKGENIVIDSAEMNNVVYMFRCQDSTLSIKGKVNSVVMDSCRKSSVVFDSLVSSIEFVNCQSVQMQVLGKVPTISIDKTDGCQMYLSADSLSVELITSKSSEMNVMVPKVNGDYAEYPVPEQFKTTISPTGLSTTAVDSLG